MDQNQDQNHNLAIEMPAEEFFVRSCCLLCASAREWDESATDTGLDSLLTPAGVRLLEEVLGKIRGRNVLSAEAVGAVRQLAETCSRRVAEF